MSSDDGPSEEELIAAYEENFVSICCLSAVCALYVYDHVLTFGQEVAMIWMRRKGLLTLIYTLLHLVTALELLWYIMSYIEFPCRNLQPQLDDCCYVLPAQFSLGIHLSCSSSCYQWPTMAVALDHHDALYSARRRDHLRLQPARVGNCRWGMPHFQRRVHGNIIRVIELATRISIIAADALVLAVTWRATFGFKRCKDSAKVKLPLTTLLLRDGTAYFSILLVLNIINIIMWTTNNVTEFPTTLTTVLLSRFILNLRQRALAPQSIVSSPSQLSDIRFSTLVQSFSDSLAHGSDEPDKEGSGESIRHDSVEGGDLIESGDEHELGVLGLRDTNGIGQESLEAAPVGSSMLLVARV
ncbi:uncharacterized protein C8Q71DRAFT_403639 [Rhodofomes roseus]|uniref:DUF6533 domain-containing protein n=1 Tax=Rhodofomes roseus TaxID=34475 RepID=A0ABQ8K014_9APHY|nr:uncharacterized protein C8Q71DRAFT_403639 [Rhodofomes roseus]KAH9829437.1 hypothetical protein C8Q71DRAFT_403639 [Rhodofomes roseus]